MRLTHTSLILTHILTEPCEFLKRRLLLWGTRAGVPADEALDALSTSISSVLSVSPVSSSHFTLVKREKVGIGRHFQVASERKVDDVETGARNHCEGRSASLNLALSEMDVKFTVLISYVFIFIRDGPANLFI